MPAKQPETLTYIGAGAALHDVPACDLDAPALAALAAATDETLAALTTRLLASGLYAAPATVKEPADART